MLDFDTMLMHVGEFGLYQKILFLFQAPFCIFVTFTLFGQLFMTLSPMNYWCEDHFACLDPGSNITSAQRRNISFQWEDGGLFMNDPCFLNNITDKFLLSVAKWDTENCPNRTIECHYNLTKESQSEQRQMWDSGLIPIPPPANLDEEGFEGERRRRKRAHGYYSSRQWSIPNLPTPRSTVSSYEETEEGDWNGGSKYGGGRGSSSGSQGGSYGEDGGSQGSRYGGSGSRYGGGGGSNGDRYGGSGGSQGDRYGGEGGSNGDRYYGSGGSQGGNGGGGGSQGGNGGSHGGNSGSSSSSQTSGKPISQENCGVLSKTRLKELGGRTPAGETAFAGWPMPECPKPRERMPKISLGPNTRILAEAMNIRRYENSKCRRINKCSKIRWNVTDLPYETIATEGEGWWCDYERNATIAQAVFFLGAIVGGFLIGWIADTFGRVPALVIANVLGALGGALSAVSTNVWIFSAMRFIAGMAFDNCFTMMYILVLEFCGPSYRTLVANLSIAIFYTIGTIALPILAWAIGNWQIYALVISLPMLLALLALFFVPESARWLLSKGRATEATKILRNFAKVNRRKVDDHVFVNFEQEATKLYAQLEQEEQEPGLTAAFRTPRLRRTFILLIIFWALIALVYDGHSRNIINLANEDLNVFWMFGIASSTEFPADMMLIFTLDRFGRRWLAFGSMTLSGAFSIMAAVITPENRSLFLVAAMISRFWVNVAFNIGLQYAAELLPTVIRAQGVNAIHIMGYVASIISPFVAAIGRSSPALSLILLGGFSMAAGFTALFLAETLGEELPNTLEEAEQFGKNQSFFNCPICAKEKEEPMIPAPAALDERPVILRNALRGSIRGETYRSSMISHGSSGGSRKSGMFFNPGGPAVTQAPEPTELTKLRRTTH